MRSRKTFIIGMCGAGSIAATLLLTACGSIKKTETTNSQVRSTSVYQIDSSSHAEIIKQSFNDTLVASNLVVFGDSTRLLTPIYIGTESKGIKTKIGVLPVMDKSGRITGVTVDQTAIAKPTTTITTHETQQASVRQTAKQDSVRNMQSNIKTSTGFAVPLWFWAVVVLLLFAAAVALNYDFKKLL